MKKFLLLCGMLLMTAFLSGHEFWLHPDKFIYKVGENVNIRFMVGENYTGENWSGNRTRVKDLRLFYSDVTDDCKNQLSDTTIGDSLRMAFFEEGTFMLAFNNVNSFIELKADEFNAYLKEDGLQEAIEYRTSHNETNNTGREYYQRSVKTIFQVGNKLTNIHKKQTFLPIDIVAEANPYSVLDGSDLKVKVLFKKKPLANAVIKVWHRDNDQTVKHEVRTNAKGEVKFPVFTSGRWMVSIVKMIRLRNDPKADWQSYWGSLTWGYVR